MDDSAFSFPDGRHGCCGVSIQQRDHHAVH